MQKPLVGVVIANRTDFNVMRRGLETLRVMGVPYLFDIIAPHKTPDRLQEFAESAGARGIEVIIATTGGSAMLPAQIASYTTLPIVGVPVDASPLRGQDALFSMVMMPPGLPVATVGINNSENAAILATQILALKHPRFREILAHRRMTSAQRAEGMLKELAAEYPDLCTIDRTAPLERENDSNDTDGSEAVTPEPPEEGIRIQPGATWVDKPSGANAQSLVSTPVPHEPGGQLPLKPAPPHSAIAGNPLATQTAPHFPASVIMTESETPLPGGEGSLAAQPRRAAPAEEADHDDEQDQPAIHTKVFRVDRANINDDLIDHVMMVLLEGGIVGIPTDTVYGLATDATNKAAVDKMLKLKGREHQKTLGVLIHHPDMLEQLVREVPPELEKIIETYWPGALTIILPKQPGIFLNTAKSDRIGIRLPDDPVCLNVISKIGRPIAMRNASMNPAVPVTTAQPLIDHYSGFVDCILDAGECPTNSGASTVLNAVGELFEVLREGSITRDELKELLGDKLK